MPNLEGISRGIGKILAHTANALKKNKKLLTGIGIGAGGGLAVNYITDDGHDKSDHIPKKYASLVKEGFDSASEEGVSWTNRDRKSVEGNLNYLEKDLKVGKKGKIKYYVSQDPKKHGSTEHMGKLPVDTVENVRKNIFKNWDNTKGSFGHFYKAGADMTPMEKADQKYAIAKSYEREGHPRKANEYKDKASKAYKRAWEKRAQIAEGFVTSKALMSNDPTTKLMGSLALGERMQQEKDKKAKRKLTK